MLAILWRKLPLLSRSPRDRILSYSLMFVMGEFLFDYDDLRRSSDPDAALLSFLEAAYNAGATSAGWEPALLGSGRPE